MHTITIHLARIGKPTRSFTEGFVQDDGKRLLTFSIVPPDVREHLSAQFRTYGRFTPEQQIATVSKYLFYEECFSILEFRDAEAGLLGYYCDIVTPLRRDGDEYFQTDLILDLWVSPTLEFQELDRDEYEQAVAEGLVPDELQKKATETMEWLKRAMMSGFFPSSYIL